jgi:hypothetical protein
MIVKGFDPTVLISSAGSGRRSAISREKVRFDVAVAQVGRLAFIVHLYRHKLATLTAGAYPTVLGHKASGREGEDLDRFAFVGRSVEPMDLVVLVTAGVVDVARRGQADLGAQLPVSKTKGLDQDTWA